MSASTLDSGVATPFDEDRRWALVRTRDPSADGTFVYAVKTTSIYCRPACSSRLARRAHVTFFNTPTEAEGAGYRPCRRCRPEVASYAPYEDMIRVVRQVIERTPPSAPPPSLEALAHAAGLTQNHFHRKFRKATGLTPRAYAMAYLQSRPSRAEESNSSAGESRATSSPFLVCEDGEVKQSNKIFRDVVETIYGYLSIAFLEGQICHLELAPTVEEADHALLQAFDEPRYHLITVEDASSTEMQTLQKHIEQITEALERPSGKMLDVPFSAAYFTN